jgi:hypothetical protein
MAEAAAMAAAVAAGIMAKGAEMLRSPTPMRLRFYLVRNGKTRLITADVLGFDD